MLLVILIAFLIGNFFLVNNVLAYVSVGGHYRGGKYVRPHVRSNPNALKYDNYSYRGGNRYNSSFYGSSRNYSSDWYVPSYRTDPYYYEGLRLYNSGRYRY